MRRNRYLKDRRERLILFFLALALIFFVLNETAPYARMRAVSFIEIFSIFNKKKPANYLVQQLEMQNSRLMAELEKAHLPKPNLESYCATCTLRDPLTPHILWINVGHKRCSFIAKNSPVCVGPHVVGIIESVGKKCSKVRLLSDPALKPHVRVQRLGAKRGLSLHYIEGLKALYDDPVSISALELIEKKALLNKSALTTARGYLCGFKYEKGKAQFQGEGFQGEKEDLQVGDLLVTSGLDGIFPEGLFVARITALMPTEPGFLSHRLRAAPSYPYDHLPALFVLPPVSEEPDF